MKKVIEHILTDTQARSPQEAEKIALASAGFDPWGNE